METRRILTIMVLALCSAASGAQYLTVNSQQVDQITLKVGQAVTVEVVSDDGNFYSDNLGFDFGLTLGSFGNVQIMPEAGNAAYSTEIEEDPNFYGYNLVALNDPPFPGLEPGVHFVLAYIAGEAGQTDLKLYHATFAALYDSVHITVLAADMGTAFTYQGRLIDSNDAADGLYDFEFELYDFPFDGNQVGSTIDINEVDVTDGYFTVELDFGSAIDGNAVWLAIGVRPGEFQEPNEHTPLEPRQRLTPTPFALQVKAPLSLIARSSEPAIGGTNPIWETSGGVGGEHGVSGYTGNPGKYGVFGYHMDTHNKGYLGGYGFAVYGEHYATRNYGILGSEGSAVFGLSSSGYAGNFAGDVWIQDDLIVSGTLTASGIDADTLDTLDSTAFALTDHAHDDRYYSETELQTSGSAAVHWENLTSVPEGFADNTDDIGGPDADWTIDGNNLYSAPSGNVGIGTSSPAAKLTVNGAFLRHGSTMYGVDSYTHVNLGTSSTTGADGHDYAYITVGGGRENTAGDRYATVGGGYSNTASESYTTVSGGQNNTASEGLATVGGGIANEADGQHATVGGGKNNTASGMDATVGGGFYNEASGVAASVPGGSENTAGGRWSFAAGYHAKVRDAAASGSSNGDEGTFVWADSTPMDFQSTGRDQFLIRASGGVGIDTNSPSYKLDVNGDIQCVTLHETSDVRFKTNITQLAGMLQKAEKVRGVSFEWNQAAERIGATPGRKHIGLVAQEVETVLPELVSTAQNGYKSVDYTKLTVVLLEAVKELRLENEALRRRVGTLEEVVRSHARLKEFEL